MKIVTAIMASNIATDFENNAWRPILEETMDKILKAAMQGRHSLNVTFTLEYGLDSALTTRIFFKGLGYTVSDYGTNGKLYYTIKW